MPNVMGLRRQKKETAASARKWACAVESCIDRGIEAMKATFEQEGVSLEYMGDALHWLEAAKEHLLGPNRGPTCCRMCGAAMSKRWGKYGEFFFCVENAKHPTAANNPAGVAKYFSDAKRTAPERDDTLPLPGSPDWKQAEADLRAAGIDHVGLNDLNDWID